MLLESFISCWCYALRFLYKKNLGVGGRRSTKFNPGGNITCNSATYLYNKFKPGTGGVGGGGAAAAGTSALAGTAGTAGTKGTAGTNGTAGINNGIVDSDTQSQIQGTISDDEEV